MKPGPLLNNQLVVVSNMFYFHPLFGEDFQVDLRIFFQMGGEKPPTRTCFVLFHVKETKITENLKVDGWVRMDD